MKSKFLRQQNKASPKLSTRVRRQTEKGARSWPSHLFVASGLEKRQAVVTEYMDT